MHVDVQDEVEELPTPSTDNATQELCAELNRVEEENQVALREMKANHTNFCMTFTIYGARVVMKTLSKQDLHGLRCYTAEEQGDNVFFVTLFYVSSCCSSIPFMFMFYFSGLVPSDIYSCGFMVAPICLVLTLFIKCHIGYVSLIFYCLLSLGIA